MEKKVKIVKLITAIIVAVMIVCTIIFTCQLVKIANYKEKTAELQTRKTELIESIQKYDAPNSYYNNNRSEYLEDYAREVLGWGKSGEIWYTSK